MGDNRMWGILLDEEGNPRKIEMEIMKFDSQKWAKKGMVWDSDFIRGGTAINDLVHRPVVTKTITILLMTDDPKAKIYDVVAKAKRLGLKVAANKKGALDRFQLNVMDNGIRRSVDFFEPKVTINQPGSTRVRGTTKKKTYLTFTLTSKSEPKRDLGLIIN